VCAATGTIAAEQLDGLAILTRSTEGDSANELERSLAIPIDAQLAFALSARRPLGAGGHGEEQVEAVVFRGEPLEAAPIETPLLSSTYDAQGRLAHAGLELWESDDLERPPLRVGGEALARGELAHPDGAITTVTFLDWHQDHRHGLGSYSITQPA